MARADLEFLGKGFFAAISGLHKQLRWRGFHETLLKPPPNGACHVEAVAKSVAN